MIKPFYMRKTSILILLILPFCTNAQIQISESIISFQKSYKSMFGKESGIITMDYFKSYTYEATDTVYQFKISIFNKKLEEAGSSSGTAITSRGTLALGLSKSYALNKESKSLELDKATYSEYFNFVNKIFVLSGSPNNTGKKLYTFEKNGLVFGAQFDDSKGAELSYFIEIEGVIYPLPKVDFIEIVTKMKHIYKHWNSLD